MTCGIYCLICVDGRRYVGKSVNIERRLTEHGYCFDIDRYEVLEECSETDLSDREWDWCEKLKPDLNKLVPVIRNDRRIWVNAQHIEGIPKDRVGIDLLNLRERIEAVKQNPQFSYLKELSMPGMIRHLIAKGLEIYGFGP